MFDEGSPASYPDFAKDIREMILYGVLRDVQGLRDLLGGSSADGQGYNFLLTGA
jgi:hypothetical protein